MLNRLEDLMPQSLAMGAFVLGAVLLLISLLSGGFKIFGAEVSGTTGIIGRLVAFVIGIFFLVIGFSNTESEKPPAVRPPTVVNTPAQPADPQPGPQPFSAASSVGSPSFPPGHGMQVCGCWGPNPLLAVPEPRCQSGHVRLNWCPGSCLVGIPYAYVCG
jgi:hypothetical protein